MTKKDRIIFDLRITNYDLVSTLKSKRGSNRSSKIVNRKFKDTLDWELIRRKIAGKLSESEAKKLRDWAAADKRRAKFLKSVEEYYAKDSLPEVDEQHIGKAWEKFRASRQNKRRIFYSRLIGWGTAALVVLTLGGGIWSYRARQPLQYMEEAAHSIPVGKNKASLILSTGEIIELQAGASRRLTEQHADIRLDSAGIAYEATDSSAQQVFNTLRVPRGGEYCLALSDGSRVWLNAKTELLYPVSFVGKERRVYLKGEAYFEVARNENRPFIIETGPVEVKVLGTSFNINAYADEPEIVTTLVTGKVELRDSARTARVLHPSEQALWNRDTKTLDVREVNASSYTQWREGKFVFRDDDLETIFRILARWYGMEYEFLQAELKKERFYGVTGRYENITELLRQFEKTGKVHFVCQGNKVMIGK